MSNRIELEDQVVAREWAEKLQKAGLGKEANFCYFRMREIHRGRKVLLGEWREWELTRTGGDPKKWWDRKDMRERVPTYTLPEVLSELPDEIKAEYGFVYELILTKKSTSYVNVRDHDEVVFLGESPDIAYKGINDKTNSATAAAKLWLQMKENKYI